MPGAELGKKIDNLMVQEQIDTDSGTPRDIYIPGKT